MVLKPSLFSIFWETKNGWILKNYIFDFNSRNEKKKRYKEVVTKNMIHTEILKQTANKKNFSEKPNYGMFKGNTKFTYFEIFFKLVLQ